MLHVRPTVKIHLVLLLTAASVLSAASRAERYAVILDTPPLAEQLSRSKAPAAAAADRRARIAAQQSGVTAAAKQAGLG